MTAISFQPIRFAAYGLMTFSILGAALVSFSLLRADEFRQTCALLIIVVRISVLLVVLLAWLGHASWRGASVRIGAMVWLAASISAILLSSLSSLLGAHKRVDPWNIVLTLPFDICLLLSFLLRASWIRKLYVAIGGLLVAVGILGLSTSSYAGALVLVIVGAVIFYVFCHPEVKKEFA